MEVIYRWMVVLAFIVTFLVIGAVLIVLIGNKQQWPEDDSHPAAEIKRRRFNRIVSHRHQ